jgi:hypothetical protein
MSQSQQTQTSASQNFTLSDNPYAVLDAVDTLALARCSEVYLQALEHYILVNAELSKEQLLGLLKLYRTELDKGLNQTADILKAALESNWGEGG